MAPAPDAARGAEPAQQHRPPDHGLAVERDDVEKCGIADIAAVTALGGHGATTVSASIRLAALAGIKMFATGGLGGVHRHAQGAIEQPFDISADLVAISRTPITAVSSGAKILLSPVENPQAYGVAEIENGQLIRIVEKPTDPKSNLAVIGIYLYDASVFEIVKTLKPSDRGELEITDVNNAYLSQGKLTYAVLDGWWADAGEDIDFYLASCNRVAKSGANLPPMK